MISTQILCRPSSPGTHKRQRVPSSHQTPDHDLIRITSKRQKLRHPEFPPRRFWERLSEVPLTRNALRALNEHRTQDSHAPAQSRTQRPLRLRPRSIVGEGYQLASQVVNCYSPTTLNRVKAFARHGGPDLTDLRGVCQSSYYPEIKC